MNIATATRTTAGLVNLALIAGGVYLAYQAYKSFSSLPNATETATAAWWGSSFGGLTTAGMGGYADFLDWYDELEAPNMDDPTGWHGGNYWAPKGAGNTDWAWDF